MQGCGGGCIWGESNVADCRSDDRQFLYAGATRNAKKDLNYTPVWAACWANCNNPMQQGTCIINMVRVLIMASSIQAFIFFLNYR
jgi:hypothetical protein